MAIGEIDDINRLKRINAALISRVERSMDQQGNAFSLFQTAINLEGRVRKHTEELRGALRRLEQSNVDLVAAKESAEFANLSKTRFLAAASHDVLQPLHAAHLSVSALSELQPTAEGKQLVGQVERALETMEDLLRTLLDISKLDAGVVRPEIGDVALEPLFQSLKSDFEPMAAKKGLALRFRPTNAVIRTDRSMFRRILQNVISNALRYTERGGVLVAARPRGRSVLVNVIDTGTGIPPDQYEAVYDEFHRGANALDGDRAGMGAGLGLGLSIVRRLVNALSHQIAFTSRLDKGTAFRIHALASHVAVAAGEQSNIPTVPRGYGLYGIKVLVVENDAAVSEAMAALLTRWSCSVEVAATRVQALARLDDGWQPDLIIADQHLDLGDLGSQTIRHTRIKAGRAIPALLITADPSDSLVAEARRSGIELMHKPVKPAELRALMAHLLA
jgi:signal transduction histidine kinase